MSITVQPLGLDDIEWFVEVAAVRMLQEELKRPELVNLDQLYTLAGKGMQDGTAWVAKGFNGNVGALGSILTPNPFNPVFTTLAEIFWWVDPSYRESRAGYLLFKEFDARASVIANEATMSLLPSSVVSIKSLEKRKFMLGEFGFRKEY